MRALVQRVSAASVAVEGVTVGEIGPGLCVFVGVRQEDSLEHAEKLADKVLKLRIFPDDQGKMNRSLFEVAGALLIISQFTLYADTRRGNRPSYSQAARPEVARGLYEAFTLRCMQTCLQVATGVFQAHMEVRLINDGPVTLLCDSEE